MYLVYASLHDDRWTEKPHLMVKLEKLQSFEITTMNGEYEKEPAANLVDDDGAREIERKYEYCCIFVPEKGGSFEEHLYTYRSVGDLHNESILCAFVTSNKKTASWLYQQILHIHTYSDLASELGSIYFIADEIHHQNESLSFLFTSLCPPAE